MDIATLNALLPFDSNVTFTVVSAAADRQAQSMSMSVSADDAVDEATLTRLKTAIKERFGLVALELSLVNKVTVGDRETWAYEQTVSDTPKPAEPTARPAAKAARAKASGRGGDAITPMDELVPGNRKYTIEGTIFSTDHALNQRVKGAYNIKFCMGDDSGAVRVCYNADPRNAKEGTKLSLAFLPLAKKGATVRVKGSLRENTYREDSEDMFYMTAIELVEPVLRQDDAEHKRVELHLHTNMSAEDGVSDVKKLIATAARWGHGAVAITDHGVVHCFPDANAAAKKHKIKVLYGVEGYLCDDVTARNASERLRHITVLAKNQTGLTNLYRLVSESHLHCFYKKPRYDKALLARLRDGLLIGSACERGELFQAVVRGEDDDTLCEIARFYDYLEIMPICNNAFMLYNGAAESEQQLRDFNVKVLDIGEKLGIPVVATGDVHFCEPEEETAREVLHRKYPKSQVPQPFYLKTTDEMLAEFAYLGEDKAYAVVVENPNAIADAIEHVSPIKSGEFFPVIEGDKEDLRRMTREGIQRYYGDKLPPMLQERVDKELNSIIDHGYAVIYVSAQRLVARSVECGYQVGSRGSVGSSIVAFLAGISEVNALPAHYRCERCQSWEFPEDSGAACGPDLPDKLCPHCGAPYVKDGYDISFAIFLGFEADKKPDIDLNFSGAYQAEAHKHTLEMFGDNNVYKAGTIGTIKERMGLMFVGEYLDIYGKSMTRVEQEKLAAGLEGVRRSTGQHPGGVLILPDGMDINEFCPVQYPANKVGDNMVISHFDYHSIEENLLKLDILGHDNPTILKMLADLTGVSNEEVPLGAPEVLQMFTDSSVLGYSKDELLGPSGAVAVPEFGTNFVRGMLMTAKPTSFDDLLRISGLSHGEMVWKNNAEDLIKSGTCTLKNVVGTRDDILHTLMQRGMEAKTAFNIMESVRKGRGFNAEQEQAMVACDTPRWYIESCRAIKYLFPKAHAVAYVMAAFRIAWYKVHYPLAFYSSYFSIRAKTFDIDTMTNGLDEVRRVLRLLKKKPTRSAKENDELTVAEVAYEFALRGFRFLPVDIYKSDAVDYLIEDGALRLPLTAIPQLGDVAAMEIVRERDKPFMAVEDLQARCAKLNKSHIESLRRLGALSSLPDTLQTSLFDL